MSKLSRPRRGTRPAAALAFASALALAASPAAALAQEARPPVAADSPAAPPPPSDTLDLATALRIGLSGSPELRQAEARELGASASRLEGWGRMIPSVNFSAGLNQINVLQQTATDPFTGGIVQLPDSLIQLRETYGTQAALSLDWTLFDGGRRYLQIRRAHAEASAAERELESVRARVGAGITLAYLDVLEAEAQRQVRASEVVRASALHEVAEARFRVGEAPEIEVLQARLARSDAELALLEAETAAAAARATLMEFLGPAGLPRDFALAPPPHGIDIEADERLRQCMLEGSAELEGLREQARAAGYDVSSAHMSLLPTIRLGTTWTRSEFGATRDALTFEPRNEQTFYRITMSWNPLDQPGRWLAERRRAYAAEATADARLAGRRLAIAREIDVAIGRIRRAQLLEAGIELNLELADRQREQAAERYRLGLAPITETIQAESLAREAERQAVAARFATLRAVAELERAAGVGHERCAW